LLPVPGLLLRSVLRHLQRLPFRRGCGVHGRKALRPSATNSDTHADNHDDARLDLHADRDRDGPADGYADAESGAKHDTDGDPHSVCG
jgi:hypothetical protein